MTNMTDDELREAISTAREPNPGTANNWIFKRGEETVIDGLKIWPVTVYPVDWLSWEYAGILLEEMDTDACLLQHAHKGGWNCWPTSGMQNSYSDRPTRAIAEAYLEWKTK